ncbi:small EDRK-rich factor 2-like isoform X1, partial [Arapaima gigas]
PSCSRAPPLPRRHSTGDRRRAPPAAVLDLSMRGRAEQRRRRPVCLSHITAFGVQEARRALPDGLLLVTRFAGGNQRELARQKNAKKQTEQNKGKRNDDGLSTAARKQR